MVPMSCGDSAPSRRCPVIERALSVDGSVTAWRFFGANEQAGGYPSHEVSRVMDHAEWGVSC